jgi:hypothetical protein
MSEVCKRTTTSLTCGFFEDTGKRGVQHGLIVRVQIHQHFIGQPVAGGHVYGLRKGYQVLVSRICFGGSGYVANKTWRL